MFPTLPLLGLFGALFGYSAGNNLNAFGQKSRFYAHAVNSRGLSRSQGSGTLYPRYAIDKREYIATAGLGDWDDCAYSTVIEIGGNAVSVIIDTGSSDLWVISDECTVNCPHVPEVPRYPQASFKTSSIESLLHYGDSTSPTHAFGLIGSDTVTLAGLKLDAQLFSAVNNTNTSILQMGSSGLLGLGFPTNSIILEKVFASQQTNVNRDYPAPEWLKPLMSDIIKTPMKSSLANKFSYFAALAPFIPRLVEAHILTQPMFSITLQRDAIDPGSGNSGLLIIGSLPDNLNESDMTWSNVRLYTPEQGGFQPTSEPSAEAYPRSWEIMVEDVYFDGELLPKTKLTPGSIGISALVDTGNSYIRGPRDVVDHIFSRVAIPPNPSHSFPCTTPHTLAFKINGTLFPIDPRDIVTQFHTINDITPDLSCSLTLAATDTPVLDNKGPLYSWSLGAPFLKSVKSTFYYGNLSHPSTDPPKIGFYSTVPKGADTRMRSVAVAAEHRRKRLPVTSEPAPGPSQQPRFVPSPKPIHTQSNSAGVPDWPTSPNLLWLCIGWVVVYCLL